MTIDKATLKRTAKTLKGLGNPCRLQIIELLQTGEKNVSEINKSIKISQPSLSQHLSKLRREGMVHARREQRQIYYCLSNMDVTRLINVAVEVSQPAMREKKIA